MFMGQNFIYRSYTDPTSFIQIILVLNISILVYFLIIFKEFFEAGFSTKVLLIDITSYCLSILHIIVR